MRARGCAVNNFERERINAMKKMFSGREGWNTERNFRLSDVKRLIFHSKGQLGDRLRIDVIC